MLWDLEWNHERRKLHYATIKCVNNISPSPNCVRNHLPSNIKFCLQLWCGLNMFWMADAPLHTLNSITILFRESHQDSFTDLILDSGNTIDFRCSNLLVAHSQCRTRKECANLNFSKSRNETIQRQEVIDIRWHILRNDFISFRDIGDRMMDSKWRCSSLCIWPFLEQKHSRQVGIIHNKVTGLLNSNMGVVKITPSTARRHQRTASNLHTKQCQAFTHAGISVKLSANLISALIIKQESTYFAIRLTNKKLTKFYIFCVILVAGSVTSFTNPILISASIIVRIKGASSRDRIVNCPDKILNVPSRHCWHLRIFQYWQKLCNLIAAFASPNRSWVCFLRCFDREKCVILAKEIWLPVTKVVPAKTTETKCSIFVNNLSNNVVIPFPTTDTFRNLFAENFSFIFRIYTFDWILGISKSRSLFDYLFEWRLNTANHRGQKSSRTIAAPVLPHALKLLCAIWRLII